MKNPLEVRAEGLYCKPGDFYIDAWSPVKQCIVTHGHSDHARFGHEHYIATENTAEIITSRLGQMPIQTLAYGEKVKIKDCWVSLHSAGHILGSAQVRIENKQTICVISGDYKRAEDSSCESFDLQQCDIFVTESTFGLPIYNWEAPEKTMNEILKWWEDNKARGYTSVLFCYALGKAQRLLSLLPHFTDEPVFVHGAILSLADLYVKRGIALGKYLPISENKQGKFSHSLILAPPSAKGSPWMKRFFPYKTGWASGWMQVRGTRKRRNVDRGFALSDHADWLGLLKTVEETQASLILTTHGNAPVLARYLQEQKRKAYSLAGTEWLDEGEN